LSEDKETAFQHSGQSQRGLAVQEASKNGNNSNPTVENPPEQTVAVEQESNDTALTLQHEVRHLMLVQLIAH
jgi:hypothetical protein